MKVSRCTTGTRLAAVLLVSLCSTCLCSWVDPDTPKGALTTVPLVATDKREYELVFSDEFDQDGRTFHDGDDPRWTAIDKNDYTNAALHYYRPENAITNNGMLNITVELKDNDYKAFDEDTKRFYMDKKNVQSAMLQGWNKFCLTGGIIEFSAQLPGDANTGGLWPALWLLGNLARATYVGSSDFVWPYSYNECTEKNRHSQEINTCQKVAHYGLKAGTGRGAPEIDVLETMQGDNSKLPHTPITRPYLSASLQIAPGIEEQRPELGQLPHKGHWYEHLEYGNKTGAALNPFFYGVTLVHKPKAYTYQADALSANMNLTKSHYQSQHIYRVEWEPPEEDGSGGYIKWFVDGDLMYGVFGDSLAITGANIPSEPMYLLMNIAVSSHWGFPAPCPEGCKCSCFECGNPECACGMPVGYCENFPSHMGIDYVRVYQAVNESKHILGCSTRARPTDVFIKGHKKRYVGEGQKEPLQRISVGGGSCTNDTDCGDDEMGKCSSKNRCECASNYTGPYCLAYDSFYENEDVEPVIPLAFDLMYMPPGLIFIVIVLLVGFIGSLLGIIRRQRKDTLYHKLGAANNTAPSSAQSTSSYQGANADYAIPANQKVVTYCVIDGRLLDQ